MRVVRKSHNVLVFDAFAPRNLLKIKWQEDQMVTKEA